MAKKGQKAIGILWPPVMMKGANHRRENPWVGILAHRTAEKRQNLRTEPRRQTAHVPDTGKGVGLA
jgi:hypothetical protein